MATIVSAETAQQAWERIGAYNEDTVLKLQKRSGRFQPELVGFVIGFTHELSPDAIGIALYAMLVVFEMFQQSASQIKKVKEQTIVRLWHENRHATSELVASRFDVDLVDAFVSASVEPAAIGYVIDALIQVQDECALPVEEVAHVLAVHKTVIEALNKAARL